MFQKKLHRISRAKDWENHLLVKNISYFCQWSVHDLALRTYIHIDQCTQRVLLYLEVFDLNLVVIYWTTLTTLQFAHPRNFWELYPHPIVQDISIFITGGAWSKGRRHLDHCLLIGWTYSTALENLQLKPRITGVRCFEVTWELFYRFDLAW